MLVAALLISAFSVATARVYERCELARDLTKLGIRRDDVATWVCIAFHESRFDTASRNPFSGDHGLLQISELYWCGPGKACGAPCSAFRDEDISDDVRCALQIYEEHTRLQGNGFLAWVVYPQHCKHNAKKYLVDCEATKSVSKSDEARSLKILEKNITYQPQLTYNYAESKKPSFLAISDLFRAHIARDFEQNYYENKKQPNWLNVKIDNVNNVITPVAGRTSPRAVATTTDPTLKGVKPPSPRKIETNQFRRRMLNFDVPIKYDYNLDEQTKTTKAPSIDNDFLSHNIFINRARALSNFNLNYIENNTQKPATTVEVKTSKINVLTKKPTSTTMTVPIRISTRRGALLVLTYPHFLYADFRYRNGVIGVTPVEDEHRIFLDLEPFTGTVVRGMKRAQFNVFLRPITGIEATQNLRVALTPILWVEEGMNLPEDFVDMLKTRLLQPLSLVDIVIPVLMTVCALVVATGVIIIIRVKFLRKGIPNSESTEHIQPAT